MRNPYRQIYRLKVSLGGNRRALDYSHSIVSGPGKRLFLVKNAEPRQKFYRQVYRQIYLLGGDTWR
jgi:hypothetical protein